MTEILCCFPIQHSFPSSPTTTANSALLKPLNLLHSLSLLRCFYLSPQILEAIRYENPQLPTTQISKPIDLHTHPCSLYCCLRRNYILLLIHLSINSTANHCWMIWISIPSLGETHPPVIFFVPHLQPLPLYWILSSSS